MQENNRQVKEMKSILSTAIITHAFLHQRIHKSPGYIKDSYRKGINLIKNDIDCL